MAASTYTQKANLARQGRLVSLCRSTGFCAVSSNLTVLGSSTGVMSTSFTCGIPGAIKSTICGDVMRIPIQKDDSNVAFLIICDTMASSSSYIQMAIRKPYHGTSLQDASPAWGSGSLVGSSADASGWQMIRTTAKALELSGGAVGFVESYIAGPFESAKYAMNFGPTSTGGTYEHGIDKNQNYFEIMVGLSTAGSTNTWTEFAASAYFGTGGAIYVVPIEIP